MDLEKEIREVLCRTAVQMSEEQSLVGTAQSLGAIVVIGWEALGLGSPTDSLLK